MRTTVALLILLTLVVFAGGCEIRAEPAYPAYPVGYYYDAPYYDYYHVYHGPAYWYYDGRYWGHRGYVPGGFYARPRYGRYYGRR